MFVRFDHAGNQIAFCSTSADKIEEEQYYECPLGFDPIIHICRLINGTIEMTEPEPSNIEADEMQVMAIEQEYTDHEARGKAFCNRVRAYFVLKIVRNEISYNDALSIETQVADVLLQIRTGDWLSALRTLQSKIPVAPFTAQYHAELVGDIENYIIENYKSLH